MALASIINAPLSHHPRENLLVVTQQVWEENYPLEAAQCPVLIIQYT